MNSIHGVSVRVLLGEPSTSDRNQVNCHLKTLSTENLNRTAIIYCLVFKTLSIINALTHISIVIRNCYLWRIIAMETHKLKTLENEHLGKPDSYQMDKQLNHYKYSF